MPSTCTTCGESLAPAAQYCAVCGTRREELVTEGVASAAPTTTMPAAPGLSDPAAGSAPAAGSPPPVTGAAWASGGSVPSRSGPPATERVRQTLLGSLEPATAMVFTAAALAFGLPSFVYAYADLHIDGYGNGPKAVLGLLLLVTLVVASAGAWAAWKRIRDWAEERTAARLVFGVGVFAAVFSLLQFFAALGR